MSEQQFQQTVMDELQQIWERNQLFPVSREIVEFMKSNEEDKSEQLGKLE